MLQLRNSSSPFSSLLAPYTANLNVLFCGSDSFAAKSLELLLQINSTLFADRLYKSLAVLSAPTNASAIKAICAEHRLAHYEAPSSTAPKKKSLTGWSLPCAVDFGLVVSFGYFIPKRLLASFPSGIVNLHPSLLPKYKGPAPLIHTLANGDAVGGFSVIELDPNAFDTGRILHQCAIPIPIDFTYAAYEEAVLQKGAYALARVMASYPTYLERAIPQDTKERKESIEEIDTHTIAQPDAPKINKSFALVRFNSMNRMEIWNKYRAISHLYSIEATFSFNSGWLAVKLMCIETGPLFSNASIDAQCSEAGAVYYDKPAKLLWIRCADGQWLPVSKFRVEGKNILHDASSFVNGYHIGNLSVRFQ